MTTPAAGAYGLSFPGLGQVAPAIQDAAQTLAAFRTLSTVPGAAAGSGCPATAAAITALGAEIAGVVAELMTKLDTDATNLVKNITNYSGIESVVASGMNGITSLLGQAVAADISAAKTVAGTVATATTTAAHEAPSLLGSAATTVLGALTGVPAPVLSAAASAVTVAPPPAAAAPTATASAGAGR